MNIVAPFTVTSPLNIGDELEDNQSSSEIGSSESEEVS